jgi:hypothetical protein
MAEQRELTPVLVRWQPPNMRVQRTRSALLLSPLSRKPPSSTRATCHFRQSANPMRVFTEIHSNWVFEKSMALGFRGQVPWFADKEGADADKSVKLLRISQN